MIKSMTGFGRAEQNQNGYRVLAEIKAVNHRHSEVVVRMPREYLLFEEKIKKIVLEHVSRGRLDVFVTIEKTEQSGRTVVVDQELAVQLKSAADELATRLGMGDTVSLTELLKLPGVITITETADNPEELESLLLGCVSAAVVNLLDMRVNEGQRLAKDMSARIVKLRDIVDRLIERSPLVVDEYRERLDKRLRDLLDGKAVVEEARLLTEVAILADRASIEEELVRLKSHFAQFEGFLQSAEPIGRKLDFLVQEMNREINTIGSKANDLLIAQWVVEAKSVLEQVREQLQNVE
jgi:uncharacterized protein (TIGR00255 family)